VSTEERVFTNPNSAFIYATVLEGAIRSQVNDGPVTTYRAGESFSEFPADRHGVSENASTTESARLLAVFVRRYRRNNPDDTLQEMKSKRLVDVRRVVACRTS
jgi:quercetin dioxygenase-like cupin family protein